MNTLAAVVESRQFSTKPARPGFSLRQIRFSAGIDLVAVAPALLVYLALVLYLISLAPSWVGDAYDDGGYFLMSRNIWRYGQPVLDHTGVPLPSTGWPPAFPILLSPLGALPFSLAVLAERLFVCFAGAALLILVYVWLRRYVGLDRRWAAGILLCLGTAPVFLRSSSVIMSDIPAAVLVMAAILLLRRGQSVWAAVALVLAYAIRSINLAVLAVAVLWLFLQGRRREAWRAGVAGGIGAAAWTAIFHSSGYLSVLLLRDMEDPAAGRIGLHGLLSRIGDTVHYLLSGGATQVVAGLFQSRTLLNHFAPALLLLSVAALTATVVGFWRRGLSLEALVCAATLSVTLIWPWDPSRFLIPIAPLMVGAAAGSLVGLGRGWTMLALTAGAATVLGNVEQFHAMTPSRGAVAERISHLERLYEWIGAHAQRGDVVLTYADIQCYLYSGHPATQDVGAFIPGRTFVADVPYGSANHAGLDLDQRLLERFSGPVVYRDGSLIVLRADVRSP